MQNQSLTRELAYSYKAFSQKKPHGTNWIEDGLASHDVLESLLAAIPNISNDRCAYLKHVMADAKSITAQTLMNPNDMNHVCAVGLSITYQNPDNPPRMELLFCDSFCHNFLAHGGTADDLLTAREQEEAILKRFGIGMGRSSGRF